MTSPTFPDGLPFPQEYDAFDAQQAYELAMRIDTYARGADAAFLAAYKPRAWSMRVTSAFAITNGTSNFWANCAMEWDTTGGTVLSNGWTQAPMEPESWWILGSNHMITNVSGTPNTGDHIEGYIEVDQSDRLTGKFNSSLYTGFTLVQESNNGGESFSTITVMKLYQASVFPVTAIYGPGTPVRNVAANSRVWGIRLGPAVS